MDMEIPLRGKKSSIKRPSRGDGATVLTQTERYSLKLLPSTPKELRKEGLEYRGSLGAAHQALAVTRERAYIWDYTTHAPVTNPRSFDVPFPVKASDPVPFGALVPAGNTMDVGLVMISATGGSVVFYDSIERAASLSLFQERRPGIEGSLGSLFSGEVVIDLVSAEHAGFIVTLNSGRLVHLALQDAQGKPRVQAQLLRATEQSSGGIFGSLKGILSSGSWKRDVAAVHTRSLGPRAPMQAVSITERAELQTWDLGWGGQSTFNGTVDFRDAVVEELKTLPSPELHGQAEEVTVLDFAILERPALGNELKTPGAEEPIDILVLVKSGTIHSYSYVLVELSITAQSATVSRVIELESYTPRSNRLVQRRPQLIVPKSQRAAFTVFEDAISISELDEPGPDAQLHLSYAESNAFGDTVYLRQRAGLGILGAAAENTSTSQSSNIAFVEGAGLARVTVTDGVHVQRLASTPIKTKIEEAVFRGALQDSNILDFARAADERYSPEEAEDAATRISDEILSSQSSFISTDPTSIESQLTYKAQALKALVAYVRQNYPTLPKSVMWKLLWDAEKVAAAQQTWESFQEHKAANSEKKQRRAATLIDEVCALAQQQVGIDLPSNEDVARNFFIHGVGHIDKLLIHANAVLKTLSDDVDSPPLRKVGIVYEADDLWTRALEAAFRFRLDNAAAYGILPEFLDDGVLTDLAEYAELPEFWTSTKTMLKTVVEMCNVSRHIASSEYEKNQDPEMGQMAQEVSKINPRLIDLMCLIYQERIYWLSSRSDEKLQGLGRELQHTYDAARALQFRALANIAQTDAGMKLAEKHRDMHILTEMVGAEVQFSVEQLADEPSDQGAILARIDEMNAKVSKYFERFGDEWANAYFDQVLSGPNAGSMFRDAQDHWQEALTRYLRADPSRNKLCWINDIMADKNFAHATEALVQVAQEQESMVWAKKIELSMSTLALLATQEDAEAQGMSLPDCEANLEVFQNELDLVGIQDELYQNLDPETRGCIDQQAALEVIMQRLGLRNQDLHSLKQLLETGLDRILSAVALSAEELIDVLTLIEVVMIPGELDMEGQEFFLALKALNAAAPGMPPERVEMLLQLIWKRCYVYDDWVEINSTLKQSSEDAVFKLRNTMPWRTIFYALDNNLFDDPRSYVRHLPPSDCLGAGCSPDDIAYRWSDADVLDAIVNDNRIQDEQLQGYVTDRRLDEWIEVCVQTAKTDIEGEEERKAQALQMEREHEYSLYATRNGGDSTLLMNGHAKGYKGIKLEEGVDEEGLDGVVDVEMA